ncbi:GNAT family N-acetyltransferase [Carnobacterium gallinarum]|uniref:GNAT family N-acetyltransferase n=1 Tax=Carnobacterium gallinarum TaxID=2749 RepID=UPI00054E3076|nr:GNAT family N-acetyltransferase [Carnobacterium gallinarum]
MHIKEIDLAENNQKLASLLEKNSRDQKFHVPPFEKKFISLAAFSDTNDYLGGITGEISWNHLHISLLAIDSAKQKNGIGSQLLTAIEAIARKKNCTLIVLETMSWQAPKFYQKHGYTIFGHLQGVPLEETTKYYLEKRLID